MNRKRAEIKRKTRVTNHINFEIIVLFSTNQLPLPIFIFCSKEIYGCVRILFPPYYREHYILIDRLGG